MPEVSLPRTPSRFFGAVAAASWSLFPPATAAAQAFPFGVPDGTVPSVGRPAAAAARPTVQMSRVSTGRGDTQFLVTISFSEVVTGFDIGDIDVVNATASAFAGSGSGYNVRITPFTGLEMRYVTVTVLENRARNSRNEGNYQGELRFRVDTRAPKESRAEVDLDELRIVFDEELDGDHVPRSGDFHVNAGGSRVHVDRVRVAAYDVILTLDTAIQHDIDVDVDYSPGTVVLQDAKGNRVKAFTGLPVLNRTDRNVSAPSPPRTLRATADGPSVIELAWQAPLDIGGSEITGYWIEVSEDEGETWTDLVRDTESTATAYRHTGLSEGTTRHYRVSAINGFGDSDPSNIVGATSTSRVPGAPTRLKATARGTSAIDLDWNAPSSGTGGSITGYRIEASPTGTGRWTVIEADTDSETTEYTHTGLDAGTTRHYRVSAINDAGRGDPSNVAHATTDATVPNAPTGLGAVPSGLGGSTRLLLTWTRPSSDGGSPVTGYRIEASPNGVTEWTVLVATTRSTGTSYTHIGLAPGTTRYYRVAAINAEGAGEYSNVASGTTNVARPGQPQGLRARADGPRSITVTWSPPLDDGGAAVTGYRIRTRSPHDSGWITIRTNTGSAATAFQHTNLQPLTAYRYQVAAINSAGAGEWSLEAGTSTNPDVPSAPFNLTARPVSASQIDLSWSAPRNSGGATVLGYRIEASSDGGRTWRIVRNNTNSTTTAYSHRNLQPASTRHYRVSAINAAGIGAPSDIATATTAALVPSTPRNLTAQADGTSRIDLSWQAPSADGGAAITGYRIEVSDDRGVTWQTLVPNTRNANTAYSHRNLQPASTRHYRVSAINRIGTGRASGVASATTDATVPDAPTGLAAAATAPTQIDLAWTAPAYDGGTEIAGYRIEVSETGGDWTDLVRNTRSTATSYAHTGLLPGSMRFYRVSAINSAGTGEPSAVASAATDDPVERAGRLNTSVLPHVAAAMTSSTVSAIADRIDAVASGIGMERRVDMGGLSSMAARNSSLRAGAPDFGRLDRSGAASIFGGSSFHLPFGASGAPQQTANGIRMATWGAGEYHHLGEPGADVVDWSGKMVSAHVGVDTRLAPDLLAGVAASHSQGTFDFTDKTGAGPVTGTYGTAMTSVNPYMAWFSGDRGNAAWATGGFGWGDVEVEDEREALRTSPARMMTGAAGGSYQLIESGGGSVRFKAEGWAGRVMVDGGERIDSVTLGMQRAKLALEWTQGYRSPEGNEIAIVFESGMRYDNGDGVNGTGMELGGGLRYANARVGLIAEGRGRLLLSGREGYQEWGFGGMIQIDPAARGEGLSIRLAPSYGEASSGLNELWDRGVSDLVRDGDPGAGPDLDAEVAYGLAGFRGTPYGGFSLTESGASAFSTGLRYDLGSGLGLRIEGTRRESLLGADEHTVGIRGRLRLR